MSIENIIVEINELKENFENCKAYFPYMNNSHIGHTEISTAPYYKNRGFNVYFNFSQPISKNHIKKNNQIGHWLNQNVLIRLYSLMEYYQFFSETIRVDQKCDGWKEVDILRRLRNIFAHKSGRYNKDDKDEKKLVEEMIAHFNLNIHDPVDFPISIDTVINPIFEGCKRYIIDKAQRKR